MNKKLIYPLALAMGLIVLDLSISMVLQSSDPIPITQQAWLVEARQKPMLLLYHLDILNLVIAWVFAVFFYQLRQVNNHFKALFYVYGLGLFLMILMNRALPVWLLSNFTNINDTNLMVWIDQGRHDAWWTLPGFLIQNMSFLLLAYNFIQNKTTRMLGILGCLGFGSLSIYLILIRFLSIDPILMGLAAMGGLVSLAFYGRLISMLRNHSI